MRREEIIINGRKLNFIQKWYFNLDNKTLSAARRAYFFLSITIMVYALIVAKISTALIIMGVMIYTSYEVLRSGLREPMLFSGTTDIETQNEIERVISKKWLITCEDLFGMLHQRIYHSYDVRVDIIKNSSGVDVIDDLKYLAAQDIPSMIPYAKKITEEMIQKVFEEYAKNSEEIKLPSSALNLEKRTTEELKQWYKMALGITADDAFAKKSIDTINREALIEFFESKFLKKDK